MPFIPNIYGLISSNNTSNTPLGIGGTFSGVGEDVSDYNTVGASIFSNVDSVIGGLQFQFSTDNTNWDIIFKYTIVAGEPFYKNISSQSKYCRVVYTNGLSVQTSFRLQTILSNGKIPSSTITNQDGSVEEYQTTRLYGTNSESEKPSLTPVIVSSDGSLRVKISDPTTAFGEVSVSQSSVQINLSFQYNINTALVTPTLVGTGTVVKNGNLAVLATGTTTGSTATLRSNKTINYVPGVGILIRFVGLFSTPVAGTFSHIGYGTLNDGFFFGYNGTDFSIIRRSEGVNNYISQSTWNIDKYDGTGGSGLTLVQTNGNIYQIQFQWLGFGAINFFIENSNTGDIQLVHQIKYANQNTTTSIYNPNGGLRLSVDNGATTSDINVKTSSMVVLYEQSIPRTIGIYFSAAASQTVSANVLQSVLTIRNKSVFETVANYVPIGLMFLSLATSGNKSVRVQVIFNATVSGATWVDVSSSQSVIEYSTTIADITDGQSVSTFYLQANGSEVINLTSFDFDVPPGASLTFACFTTNATNDNGVSITWNERF